MQIAATLVKGKARIKFEAPKVEVLLSLPGKIINIASVWYCRVLTV